MPSLRCPCGHDRHDHAVQPILKRGPWRALLAVVLVSEVAPSEVAPRDVAPREIRFVCAACGAEVERASDAETLRQYGRWPRVDRQALQEQNAAC